MKHSVSHKFTKTRLLKAATRKTGNITCKIVEPEDYKGDISIDEKTGALTFKGIPGMITIQATHAIGYTGKYPFTVADHFDARYGHSSVVLGSDIYVIGGYDGIRCKEVWKSDKSETSFFGELKKRSRIPCAF